MPPPTKPQNPLHAIPNQKTRECGALELTWERVDGGHPSGPIVTLIHGVSYEDCNGHDPADQGHIINPVCIFVFEAQALAKASSAGDRESSGTLLEKRMNFVIRARIKVHFFGLKMQIFSRPYSCSQSQGSC